MINLEYFVKAMKGTWITRLLQTPNSQWATLFQKQCCPIRTLLDYGPQGVYTIVSKSKNQFWNEWYKNGITLVGGLVTWLIAAP